MKVLLELVLSVLMLSCATTGFPQQPSTVPAASANTASVQRTSGNLVTRLRQPAAPVRSQPAFHYDALLNEEESHHQYQPREPYTFGYDVKDDYGNQQYRKEESDASGNVRGSYGYTDANGVFRVVDYVADINGFRASIRSNEPGIGNAQAANVLLNAEAPPANLLIPSGVPIGPPIRTNPVFPGPPREPRFNVRDFNSNSNYNNNVNLNRGFSTGFHVNHNAAASDEKPTIVSAAERLRSLDKQTENKPASPPPTPASRSRSSSS